MKTSKTLRLKNRYNPFKWLYKQQLKENADRKLFSSELMPVYTTALVDVQDSGYFVLAYFRINLNWIENLRG